MSDQDLPDEGELLMGCWDCGSCGAQRVRGDAYECAACGAPRPDDVEFYLPDDAERITDAGAVAAAEAGVDWQCAFCESWMPATDQGCSNCGASFADSERRQKEIEYDQGAAPRSTEDIDRARDVREGRVAPPVVAKAVAAAPAAKPRGASKSVAKGCLALAGLFFVGIFGVATVQVFQERAHEAKVVEQKARIATAEKNGAAAAVALKEADASLGAASSALAAARQAVGVSQRRGAQLASEQQILKSAAVPVTVASHGWQVSVSLEECRARSGEGWSQPSGAFDVRSEQREHHKERVLDRVETRYRTETYRAQDGYDTKTYTERVRAGTKRVKSGTTTKSLGNGRFKRVPKYRNETVYKTVTKTKRVPRYVTRRRQVPYQEKVYRQDPVYKTWYRYKTKYWEKISGLSREGEGLEPLDPAGTPLAQPGDAVGARRVTGRRLRTALQVEGQGGGAGGGVVALDEAPWRRYRDGAALMRAGDVLMTAAELAAQMASLASQAADEAQQLAGLEAKVPPLAAKVPPLEAAQAAARKANAPFEATIAKERAALVELQKQKP